MAGLMAVMLLATGQHQRQQYVVTFHSNTDPATEQTILATVRQGGGSIHSIHSSADLLGFVGSLSEELVTSLRQLPAVKRVEIDRKDAESNQREGRRRKRRAKPAAKAKGAGSSAAAKNEL